MNKSELNRKIQLLEQENEKLGKMLFEIKHTYCNECNKKRDIKLKDFRKRINQWADVIPNYIRNY